MVNDDQVPISPSVPAGINDHTCIGGIDRIPFCTGKVDPIVANIRAVVRA